MAAEARHARRVARFVLLLGTILPGCSESTPGPGDATDGGDGDGGGWEAATPDPPVPPVLTPCPEGWDEVPPVREGGPPTCEPWPDGSPVTLTPCPGGWREIPAGAPGEPVVCEPWPETGRADCVGAEAHFPGEPACATIGTPCAADDDWATDLPADGSVLYVLAGAPTGGSGTRAAPHATIAEALAVAADGDVIALGKGTYAEDVPLPGGVTLWGACATETVIDCPTAAAEDGIVTPSGAGSAVRNLTITGARYGVRVGAGTSVHLEGVRIERATAVGLLVVGAGAEATARTLVVRETRSRSLVFGRALHVERGGRLEVTRGVLDGNREVAAGAMDEGSELILTGVSVFATRGRASDGEGGASLGAALDARAEATACVFEENGQWGVTSALGSSVVVLSDCVVRDTNGHERTGIVGRGISVESGARAEIARTLFERNRENGVLAMDSGSRIVMGDVVIRDTRPQRSDGEQGHGIGVGLGARLEGSRVLLERNCQAGLFVREPDSVAILSDVIARDTRPAADGTHGHAVYLENGARAEVSRALFERATDAAVLAFDAGTSLVLTDAVIRDTQSRATDFLTGSGIVLQTGVSADVSRTLLERNRMVGVFASGAETTLRLQDAILRDTRSLEANGSFGYATELHGGLRVELARVLLEGNRGAGLKVSDPGTTVVGEDVEVRDTLELDCAASWCAAHSAGVGIVSLGGAQLELTRFVSAGSALCGLQLAHGADDLGVRWPAGGEMDLHHGRVLHNVIGVNVQTEGFEIERLMDHVLFEGNVRNLDSDVLPVPETAPAR